MRRLSILLVLISAPALASTSGLMSGSTSGDLNLIVPICAESGAGCVYVLPAKTKCDLGWVLVQVGQVSGGAKNKCAAVGDLRDPE